MLRFVLRAWSIALASIKAAASVWAADPHPTTLPLGSAAPDFLLINAFDPDWQGQVPYTVLISPEGKVLYHETDRIDPLTLKRAIVKALNEKKPW